MKYQNANNFFFPGLSVLTLFFTFIAHAHIENTVIANYDLNTGKNVHYELITSPLNKNMTVTLIPLEQNNKMSSTFKIASCINHSAGLSKQGEFHFSTTKPIKTILGWLISGCLSLSTTCIRGGFI